ncbi:hypothetical protein EVAR_29950_1 [Eumeta japonica]|uniref:Uncharacterized protein n=1 Tax=Eumeta variegata TaxID=151549 RepID=A0A4C1VGQ2_EUMVA|nr:hypothetical protein EVAR_29950_1 [Eumeta japonica]
MRGFSADISSATSSRPPALAVIERLYARVEKELENELPWLNYATRLPTIGGSSAMRSPLRPLTGDRTRLERPLRPPNRASTSGSIRK